jgi:hypothetical protein
MTKKTIVESIATLWEPEAVDMRPKRKGPIM